jgi:hypothetical protein
MIHTVLLFAAVLLSAYNHAQRASPPAPSTAVSVTSAPSRPALSPRQAAPTPQVQPVGAQTAPPAVAPAKEPAKEVPQEVKPIEAKKVQEKATGFDLDMLAERLKQTSAIGVFTKLAINSEATDLIEAVKKYRKLAVLQAKHAEVRSRFDGLVMKILALLEGDPQLARDIYAAREQIWSSLLEVTS